MKSRSIQKTHGIFRYLLYLLVAPANSTYITKDLNLY